jgi:hypothetical protein
MSSTLGSFFDEESKNLDHQCLDVIDSNINMTVPWYLMAAYAYYLEDDPILSDSLFDRLAKKMLEHWSEIEHQHKHCITKNDLEAGSYLGEYPSRVEGGLQSLREIYYGKNTRRTNRRSTRRSKNS